MTSLLQNRWLILLLRFAIGGTFVYAGITKISEPQSFADSIATFRILPDSLINILALSLPPFEIIAGGMLVAGLRTKAAAFAILVLTAVFAIALSQALVRGLEVDCGCFGSGRPAAWKTWAALGRDIFLFLGAFLIYCRRLFATSPPQTGGSSPAA